MHSYDRHQFVQGRWTTVLQTMHIPTTSGTSKPLDAPVCISQTASTHKRLRFPWATENYMDPQIQRLLMLGIFGIVAGWLAGMLVGHPKGGFIGSMIAGLIGSIVGSYILSALKVQMPFGNELVNSLAQATIGAAVVLLVARIFL
jgi:uncharacterized membrane protein YeaQ/YmgE (transglycosylase-associated protein family)